MSLGTSAAASPPWPGITTGNDARCACTWALWRGVLQVKFTSRMCPVEGHRG